MVNKYDTVGNLMSEDEDIVAYLKRRIEELEEENARLKRDIAMKDLTLYKMKNELDGIPNTTPYSNTAELRQNQSKVIAEGEVDALCSQVDVMIGKEFIIRKFFKYQGKNIQLSIILME